MSSTRIYNIILKITFICFLSLSANNANFAHAKQKKTKPAQTKTSKNKAKTSNNSSKSKNKNSVKSNQIESKKKELQNLNSEIKQTQEKINKLAKQENIKLQNINQFQKKDKRLNQFIFGISKEINILHDSLNNLNAIKSNISNKLNYLQNYYANALKTFNLNTQTNNLSFLENDNNLDNYYHKTMANAINENAIDFKIIIDSVKYSEQLLTSISNERENQKYATIREQKNLKNKLANESVQLQNIRKDKTKLLQQLKDKKNSAARINSLITSLVKKEISKQNKLAQSKKENQNKNSKQSKNESKSATKAEEYTPKIGPANLSWPSSSRRILRKYGIYTNPETNVKIDNPGIDIACPKGSSAISAGDGIVSYVDWMPGFGNIVIVDHQNGWRTVYANLSSVSVSANQKVKKGGVIGKTGSSEEGEYLHFEVYKGKSRMNPQGVF